MGIQYDLVDYMAPAAALWRVSMSALDGGRSWPVAWEGYAASSTDATDKARAWARAELADVAEHPQLRVLEVLQVGT